MDALVVKVRSLTMLPRRTLSGLLLGLATALPAIQLLLPHLSFVPFWDAGDYFFRLRRAALSEFEANRYYLSGHPTFLFALVMSVPIKLFPWNVEAVHLTSIALFALSVASVRSLAQRLRPGPEATVLAVCYSACPALLGNVLYFTPDFGVACLFPIYLALLVSGPGSLSVLAGSVLANTKELGFVLYLACVPAYLVSFGWRRTSWKRLAFLSLPALVTIALRLAFAGPPLRREFVHSIDISPLNILWEPKSRAYLVDLFVLSFGWVWALVLAAGVPLLLGRGGAKRPLVRFLLILFAACLYAITRVPTYNNVRYMLPAYAPLFLLAYSVLPGIVRGERSRTFAIAAFAPLLLASSLRSFDPVSSWVFSPLRFGERTVWSLQGSSVRDQLVYNLEYLQIHHLLNDLLAEVKPEPGSVFAGERSSDYYNIYYLEPVTFARSIREPGDISFPKVETHRPKLLRGTGAPRVVHFVDYPNLGDPDALPALRRLGYLETKREKFERDGYELLYIRFERISRR